MKHMMRSSVFAAVVLGCALFAAGAEAENLARGRRCKAFSSPDGSGVASLHWVECSYDSIHGRITSNWRKRGNRLVMAVVIPANTTATVYVPVASKPDEDGPSKDAAAVTESGKPIDQSEGVRFLRMADGRAVFEVASGIYDFRSIMK